LGDMQTIIKIAIMERNIEFEHMKQF